MPQNTDTLLVRIKPFGARNGGGRTHSYTYQGTRYQEADGWYEVSADLGEQLRYCTIDGTEDGLAVFDVATQEEAERLESRQREQVQRRAPAASPMKIIRTQSAIDAGAPRRGPGPRQDARPYAERVGASVMAGPPGISMTGNIRTPFGGQNTAGTFAADKPEDGPAFPEPQELDPDLQDDAPGPLAPVPVPGSPQAQGVGKQAVPNAGQPGVKAPGGKDTSKAAVPRAHADEDPQRKV